MAGRTLDLEQYLLPDLLGTRIAEYFMDWETRRQNWVTEKKEIQQYVFATDTKKTTNAKLPWSNKTTIPKLCQIRDNLYSNYMAALFPRRKWLSWEADNEADDVAVKRQNIESYMSWVVDRPQFYSEVGKLVLDYIDYGNAITMPDWVDERVVLPEEGRIQTGYVGPVARRINPLDMVINPVAPSFSVAPKIAWSLVSLGEVKEMLERDSLTTEEREDNQKLWDYMIEIRQHVADYKGDIAVKDDIYKVQGFDSFRAYLQSNYAEVLTFYGDIFDENKKEFLRNQVIMVVDRHKVLSKRTNPSFFGQAPIYHVGWRTRQDNLWAMGPLDNLVGMQYRIDHLENMKADVFDLIAYPPIMIQGYVEDFEWGPFERIFVGDDGKVELMSPDVQALNADNQIALLEMKMEEMAGSPKEAMGFRTPGEKTAYEVQRLENAAARIFQNKIAQFERDILEPLLNSMLELARRKMDPTTIRIFDSELDVATFQNLSPQDITGSGRIRPVAARNFAEKATMVQNMQGFYTSAQQDQAVIQHFSSVDLANFWAEALDFGSRVRVQPYIRLAEQVEAQKYVNVYTEQLASESMTSSGLFPDDFDLDQLGGLAGATGQGRPQPTEEPGAGTRP